jgi:hypothetical protein
MRSILKCFRCKKSIEGQTYIVYDEEAKKNVRICQTCKMIEKLKDADKKG